MSRTSRTRVGLVLAVSAALAATSLVFGTLTSKPSLARQVDRTLKIVAEQDTFATSLKPTASRWSADRLVARHTPGVRKVSYLQFTIPQDALGEDHVVGAKVLLNPRGSLDVPVKLRRLNARWSERLLTHQNAPRLGAAVGQVPKGSTTARWVDVSSEVTKAGTYSFALTTKSGTARFSSMQTEKPPVLIVRVKRGPRASTPTPSPSPSDTPSSSPSPSQQPQPSTTSVTPSPGPSSGTCNERFPGDPCAGAMYYGASVEGGDPRTLENELGQGLTLFRSYMQASTSAAKFGSRASADVAAGRIPLISTKVPGSWADVVAGKHDAWLLERIRVLDAVKGPVWLVLHHEPRNDGAPADWVRMQQRARMLIDANSDNIALVGILNGWDFLERNGDPERWRMPVGTGVDVMGFDNYNPWSPTNGMDWKPADVAMSPGLAIQSWGYPTLVGEYGVRTDPDHPGRAAQWLKDVYDLALGHGFVGISYFDSGANSPDGTWDLTGERLEQYGKNLARPETARFRA